MPVAQLDRVSDSDSEGRWFESSRARHAAGEKLVLLRFFVVRKPLARRVVPKKTIVDNEGRKTPFAIIDARSGNCTKEAKGGHSE